jgi:hypothetical protein
MGRWIACVIVAVVFAHRPVAAQPDPTPAPDDEIQLDPDPVAPSQPAPAPKDPRAAKKAHQVALQAVAKGDAYTRRNKTDDAKAQYEIAEQSFRKSIELGGDATVQHDLANTLAKLGRFADAVRELRVVVKAQGVRADVMKKATAKLDELSAEVGTLILAIKPEGASISLGGVEIGKAPLADSIVLMPGTYTIAFAADGHQPREIEFKVEAGSESERTVELEEIAIVVEPVKPKEPDVALAPPPVAPPSKRMLYIGGGVTLGLVAIGTITGLVAVGRHGTFNSDDATPTEREDAKSSGKSLALTTDLCLIGAVIAGGYTAYHYLYKYRPAARKHAESKDKLSAKVDLVPWVQPASGGSASMVGAGLSGSF